MDEEESILPLSRFVNGPTVKVVANRVFLPLLPGCPHEHAQVPSPPARHPDVGAQSDSLVPVAGLFLPGHGLCRRHCLSG